MAKQFDAIIIGGGNAGFGVSSVLNHANKNIAFIEQAEFGGTCPNRGCTPKKVLVSAAKVMDEINHAKTHGIDVDSPKLNWQTLIERKNNMMDFIPDAMKKAADKRGTVYQGQAKFVAENKVEVNGEILEAETIVIATGSKTRPLPIEGAKFMITSDEVLSNKELPKEVIFIGGGVIALEFSHVYVRAGVKVTILEVAPQLLPRLDTDAVAMLHKATESLGVTVKSAVKVNKVTKTDNGLEVHYEHDGQQQTQTCDTVVNGAGRIANVDELNLTAGNIKHEGFRVATDKYFRSTSNSRVWLTGDAIATTPQLSPIATYEGKVLGQNIINDLTNEAMNETNYDVLPTAVYTIPALSTVGLTEQEVAKSNINYEVIVNDMSEWFSSKNVVAKFSWSKLIVCKDNDKILGAHILGHHGEELINIFALAMRFNITRTELKSQMYAYPTFSSDIKNIL